MSEETVYRATLQMPRSEAKKRLIGMIDRGNLLLNSTTDLFPSAFAETKRPKWLERLLETHSKDVDDWLEETLELLERLTDSDIFTIQFYYGGGSQTSITEWRQGWRPDSYLGYTNLIEPRIRELYLVLARIDLVPESPHMAKSEVELDVSKSSNISDADIDDGKLYEVIFEKFSLDDLRLLCMYLKEDFDDLPGEGKSRKILELISKLKRQDRMLELTHVLPKLNPSISGKDFK